MLFMLLGGLLSLASFVCTIIILIAAFKDEIWKGVVGLLCSLYLLYYGLIEFDVPNKWTIVLIWLVCGFLGGLLYNIGAHSALGAQRPY